MKSIITIDNIYGDITTAIPDHVTSNIARDCTYSYMVYTRGKPRLEYKHLFDYKTKRFRVGLLGRVCSHLREAGIDFEIVDTGTKSKPSLNIQYVGPRPWPHQVHGANAMVMAKRGITMVATGGGKTGIMAMAIAQLRRKAVVLVHRSDLLYQTYGVFKKVLKGVKIGFAGDGMVKPGDVVVGSIWTLINAFSKGEESEEARYLIDFMRTAGVIILDESHITPMSTAQTVLKEFENADYVFGVSATPDHMDGEELELEAAFGDTLVKYTASDVIKLGFIVRPRIYFVDNIKAPTATKWIQRKEYQKLRDATIVENEYYIDAAVAAAEHLRSLDRTTMVLVRTNAHGERISEQLKCNFVTSKMTPTQRQKIWKKVRSGDIKLIVCNSQIAGAGLDIPSLDAAVLADDWNNSVIYRQIIGRFLRKHKDKNSAVIVDLIIPSDKYADRVSDKTRMLNKLEPEFNVVGRQTNIKDIT